MAQIQMTPELSAALIARMQAEYGQQALSNFALDILLDSANANIATLLKDVQAKDEVIGSLRERAKVIEEELEKFRQADDPKRREVIGGADKVRRLQADRINGSNPDTK